MKPLSWIGLIASITFIFNACGKDGASSSLEKNLKSGKPVASRDGVEIHEGYIKLLTEINPNISNQLKSAAGKKRLVDNLIEQEILFRESQKRGIQKIQKYREKAALYERVIYAQGLVEEEIEKKAKEYYDKNKENEFKQVEIAHILIRLPRNKPQEAGQEDPNPETPEAQALQKAKEAKKKLEEGVAWEEVVAEYSDDRLTKKRQGKLGKLNRKDRRTARLEWNDLIEKAFVMKVNEISEPIKAKDGYHIIKVTEAAAIAPYDEVENRIKFRLRAQVKRDVLASLSKDTKTKYLDEEIKAVAAPKEGKPSFPPRPQVQPAPKSPQKEGEIAQKPTETKPAEKPTEKKPTETKPSN